MEPMFITGTDETPEVYFDNSSGLFEIKGKSLPEEVIDFYAPIFAWLEEYVKKPTNETIIKVKVDYFNSSSQRALNEIFNILSKSKKKVEVEWYYIQDDDEMREAGEEFADITQLEFKYISYVPE